MIMYVFLVAFTNAAKYTQKQIKCHSQLSVYSRTSISHQRSGLKQWQIQNGQIIEQVL